MFRVLVVDDEIYAVKGIVSGINWRGLDVSEVYEAFNAREAKKILERNSIDLIICDINMPEENGLELLEWAKENYPELEAVFLTCHTDFNYVRKALLLGSCDYLLKPVIYGEMEEVLSKNFARLVKERNNLERMESFKLYYNIEEQWKSLLVTGDPEETDTLIKQTMNWIVGEKNDKGTLIKIYQNILQTAVFALKKRGLPLDDLNSLELSREDHVITCTNEQFKHWMESIVKIVCTDSSNSTGEIQKNRIVYELQKYIQQNLNRKLTRDELSEYVHLNESYLSRLFHKQTGMSLSDYILQERMKLAKVLITESDMPIYGIANRLCYDNFSYFAKMFKKVYNLTPLEYRKKYKNSNNSNK